LKKIAERKQTEMDRDHLAATERKRTEEALQRSEALYRLVVENINDIVWTFDLSSMTYTFVSPSLQRILGYDDETMVKNLDVIFTPETKQHVLKAFGKFLESNAEGDILVMNAEHRHKDGNLIWMEISASPLKDDLGNIAGFLGTTRDITERRRAEEEKAKLEGQLHQAQKMESVGRLAGGVAHDFNNMLGIIIGHAELAMGQVDPSQPLHAHLAEILKAANHSADLTRQLLAFARKQTIAPKVLDLNETVGGMLKMLRRLIGENIVLNWRPKADLWPVKVDPSQIDQILANLCVNSRDAIAGVGKLNIETGNRTFDGDYCGVHAGFTPGEYVMLAVSDDGCGVDKKTMANIFEPFFTTKEMGKGTGLGLSTVYGIVKQNSGFINVYSEPGQGTTFTIYLSRHKGNASQMQKAALAEPVARGDETILLVEDEPAILELIMLMLEKLGYTVLTAGTPGDSIRLAAGEHTGEIHLLMTDVVMPEMNGKDLAGNLLSFYPHLKHLFMSGYTADVIAHNGIMDEGLSFIQKPFSMKELAAKVREALGE
jgi:two-component system, cell cycle sensor histidine kinase and response regulator CckA